MMLTGLLVGSVVGSALVPSVIHAAVTESDREVQSSGRGAAPPTLSWEWWNDADVQKELGLAAEKIERINSFYARRNAELRPVVHEYQKQLAELDKLTRERLVDPETYLVQVLRVEAARSRLSESRTMLLYRMYRELTPEQHRKLQDMMDRRFNRNRPAAR
jgi:Spy/CpxP family protein refolding chaperone